MVEIKEALLQFVEKNADSFFAMAQDIFDHPELGRAEYYASNQLTTFLENEGFVVERGIAGIKTAFRATWERGNGGPSIGFMMEYDALKDLGHACGHHLQGPTCIGAALALKAVCDQPFKLVLYGTPDEEVSGGKIDMVNAGCFQDVDVIFSYHTGMNTGCSFSTAALAPIELFFAELRPTQQLHRGMDALLWMLCSWPSMVWKSCVSMSRTAAASTTPFGRTPGSPTLYMNGLMHIIPCEPKSGFTWKTCKSA